jgi:hypothetical protein
MNTFTTVLLGGALAAAMTLAGSASAATPAVRYFDLSTPTKILEVPQAWEGDQQPHTLSVIELDRQGFKYWGWYGLNQGRGMGLARSNDLVHWTKDAGNPIWTNARWPSVLKADGPDGAATLYFAVTRDYDTPTSHIVLATSSDGVHLKEVATLVAAVPGQRNQNPNLFRDPRSGRYFLTFYRGNDRDHFEIVSKSAETIPGLAQAPEKVLLSTRQTVAAPTLLYVPKAGPGRAGRYFMATEIYPGRYAKDGAGWQVKVFQSDRPDGKFEPVAGNPVQVGDRACLFQFIFDGKYYGFQSHLDEASQKWDMEVITAALPR